MVQHPHLHSPRHRITAGRSNLRTAILVVTFAALAGSACTSSDPSVQIGLRRISLDLAFADEDAAKASPSVALQPTPVPGQIELAISEPGDSFEDREPPTFTFPPVVLPCPGPSPDAVPAAPVDVDINNPIIPGRHATRVKGYFVVEGGSLPVSGTFPETSQFVIRNVVAGTDTFGVRSDTLEIHRPGGGDSFSTTTYRLTNRELQIIKTVTKTSGGESTFAPAGNPPIMDVGAAVAVDVQGTGNGGQLVGKDGAGNTWSGSGTDPSTGASTVIDGTIVSRERVKLCGEVIEAWRVETSERFVDVERGIVSQTTDLVGSCKPGPAGEACTPSKNVRWIATQHGALIAREDLHMQITQGGTTTWIEKSEMVDAVQPEPVVEAS